MGHDKYLIYARVQASLDFRPDLWTAVKYVSQYLAKPEGALV